MENYVELLFLIVITLTSFLAQNFWFSYIILESYFDDEEKTSRDQYNFYKNILIIVFCGFQLLCCSVVFYPNLFLYHETFLSILAGTVMQGALVYLYMFFYDEKLVTLLLVFWSLGYSMISIVKHHMHSLVSMMLIFLFTFVLIILNWYFKHTRVKWLYKRYNVIYSFIYSFAWSMFPLIAVNDLFLNKKHLCFLVIWISVWFFSCLIFLINRNIKGRVLEYNMRLREASIDYLTKIGNRASFEKNLEKSFQFYKKVNSSYSFALFDIDKFKEINDTFGHIAGDKVLVEVAKNSEKILFTHFKNSKLYRVGGDEFAIAFRGRSGDEVLPILIEISKKINSHPINYKGKVISVSISAGLAEMSTKNLVARDLYEEADNYLYYSKKNGRNKVIFNGKLY